MKEVDKQAAVEEVKKGLSRKGFLLSGAGILGASAIIGALPGMAGAHETEDGVDDELILNYALTLEHLEAAFYNRGVPRFRNQLGARGLNRAQMVRMHENEHVSTLRTVINETLEGQAVPPASYDFGLTNVDGFLKTAQILENTGVRAYDGAIAHINSAQLLRAGATIATVEARHASYYNEVNGVSGFPTTFDKAVSPQRIIEIVSGTGFITGTPTPYGPYENFEAFVERLPDTTTPRNEPAG